MQQHDISFVVQFAGRLLNSILHHTHICPLLGVGKERHTLVQGSYLLPEYTDPVTVQYWE